MNTTLNSKPNALREAATYGLYIGLFLIVCSLLSSFIGGGFFLMVIKLIGSIALLIYAMRRYRDINNGGYITYVNSFSFGMLTSMFSTVLFVAYFLVMVFVNASELQNQMHNTFDEFIERGLVQDDAISTFSYMVDNIRWILPMFLFIWSMFFGLIYSLIIAATVVRKKSVFEE